MIIMFKFDHMSKLYMHNQESVLENKTLIILWGFEIQTDDPVSVRRPDLVIVNIKKKEKKKEKLPNSGLGKAERKRIELNA